MSNPSPSSEMTVGVESGIVWFAALFARAAGIVPSSAGPSEPLRMSTPLSDSSATSSLPTELGARSAAPRLFGATSLVPTEPAFRSAAPRPPPLRLSLRTSALVDLIVGDVVGEHGVRSVERDGGASAEGDEEGERRNDVCEAEMPTDAAHGSSLG